MALRKLLEKEALKEERLERRKNHRRLRDSFNTNLVPDYEFVANYRLSRTLYEELCQDIVPLLPRKRTSRAIEPATKILVALNFYARGSYQGSVGQNNDTPMAQQTVSRCIREVSFAINTPEILRKYIKFPQNATERDVIKKKFHKKYNLPGAIGCIDCTQIAIVKPGEHEGQFFNRNNFHSLNTQVICDSDCVILNVDASFGGATDDAYIWSQCEILGHLESLTETTYLLGDSRYPLREYLLTPISNVVENSPEARFNAVHKRAHSTIERTFRILKGRWRCLLAARELHYDPDRAGRIILACCVLHNMCIRAGVSAPKLTEADLELENSRQVMWEKTEGSFNALHKRACSNQPKGQWRCHLAARELHYDTDREGRIILACCDLLKSWDECSGVNPR